MGGPPGDDRVGRAVEHAARQSYGRLVAFLAARSRDVAAAEDALGDAFQAALQAWAVTGVPDKPEAWLLTAARRRLIDAARHRGIQGNAGQALLEIAEEARRRADGSASFPDERLGLLFLCAHPAIDPGVRTALMLQTVLGLDAARIGSAFLVRPATMGQRLSRAKAKIRDAGIPFVLPQDMAELAPRLDAVLEAIYAAYGSGWEDMFGAEGAANRRGLADEALELGRLLLSLLPDEPEATGLVALMLHCEARRGARRTPTGEYVPLSAQDVSLWSLPMMIEADALLRTAERHGRPGGFQLEAAIQSAHARRAFTGAVDWETVALLYEGLVRLAPTVGAFVGRAAAVAEARGEADGLRFLDAIPQAEVESYQPYWAVRAHLLGRLGRRAEAEAAYVRARGLTEDPAVRAFLSAQARNPAAQARNPAAQARNPE